MFSFMLRERVFIQKRLLPRPASHVVVILQAWSLLSEKQQLSAASGVGLQARRTFCQVGWGVFRVLSCNMARIMGFWLRDQGPFSPGCCSGIYIGSGASILQNMDRDFPAGGSSRQTACATLSMSMALHIGSTVCTHTFNLSSYLTTYLLPFPLNCNCTKWIYGLLGLELTHNRHLLPEWSMCV